jgi:hypothetical protein
LRAAVGYYKKLFGREDRGSFSLQSDFWEAEDKVTPEENIALQAPFLEEEVKAAVFNSYLEGAPGPDGLPFLFFQRFWGVIKEDFMRMFKKFQEGDLDLFRLNFAAITLIPKTENADDIRSFRPISLLNCSFKIFSRVLTSSLENVCHKIIAKEQSAFIKGRFILESVVIAHEVLHTIHQSKQPGVILKLDYEKAYDRVNLDFLIEILESRGFGETWIG